MLLNNKKAYLRTFEALFAILITLLFLVYIIPNNFNRSQTNQRILEPLMESEAFRSDLINLTGCVSNDDNVTLSKTVSSYLESDYEFFICKDTKPEIPRKEVIVESSFFTGNITDYYNNTIIRVYYYKKE